jgi:RNA polymerase sigma factor (sigma-70 family)
MAAESVAAHIDVDASSRAAVEERFRNLLDGNAATLARLAASYTWSASDRDDLLQEIAMALWQALPRFRGECSERTFLFRIAHNRCLSHLSRRRSVVPIDEETVDVADPKASAEQQLTRDQQRERLVRAVRRLPLIYRQVVTLTLEGLTYKELAEVLGISESNVGVRLNRGRQLLKSLLLRSTGDQ